MFCTGFVDEAASGLSGQIQAAKALNWDVIESRNVDGQNLHNLPEAELEKVISELKAAKIGICCLGSEVANWCKSPWSEDDFFLSVCQLEKSIKIMKQFNCKMLRGMSFAMQKSLSPRDIDLEKNIYGKIKTLVKICEANGIIYAHENCMNYGGQSYEHTLRLIEAVNSPNFKLIFDTGNPVFSDLRIGSKPYVKQSAYDFYSNVKEFICHVHIKDAVFEKDIDGELFPKARYTFAGDGDGEVVKIVTDLLKNNYDGAFSMEPHLSAVYHNPEPETENRQRFEIFVEYGKKFEKLLDKCKKELN